MGRGEHAGGVVDGHRAFVALEVEGDPTQLVQRVGVGSADLRVPPRGDPAATSATVAATSAAAIGWMGVRGRRNGVAVGGPGQEGVDELHELGGADDGVRDGAGLEDVFLEGLGAVVVEVRHLVGADDGQDDEVSDARPLGRGQGWSIEVRKNAAEASSKVGELVRLTTTSAPASAASTP